MKKIIFMCIICGLSIVCGSSQKDVANKNLGITWTVVKYSPFGSKNPFGGLDSVYGIAYGNGRFVVGGLNWEMAYSNDGKIWTAVKDSPFILDEGDYNAVYSIAYGNDRFVAGGEQGKMAYSSDGKIWTAVKDNTFDDNSIYSIVYGNGRFVAVGSGKMAYSIDGEIWIAVKDNTFDDNTIYSIAYGNGRFVAGGLLGKIAYSDNGISWNEIKGWDTFNGSILGFSSIGDFPNSIRGIVYGNGRFVCGGEQSKMAYSSDGISWIKVKNSSIVLKDIISSIAYGNGRFVAGGQYRGMIMYSDDNGETWSVVQNNELVSNNMKGIKGIVYGNGCYCLVLYIDIFYSIKGIVYGNGRFVALGGDGKIAYSPAD
ncbi:MAG: exo-alpha-sialidase [Leptospirales bacterium]|nr:exo-alpha-sialidase [Leptospirales bacterium]